ncbi:MAG: TIGR00341 family protein [Planctomycetota bacterium]|jgi:uncharacterized hydrophobic protein (TIGR00341 family)
MALRFVEIFIPVEKEKELFDLLTAFESITIVQKECSEKLLHAKLLLNTEHTEELMDRLEARFANIQNFRIVIVAVQATIPRIETTAPVEKITPRKIKFARISREELYHNILEASRLSWLFATMVALSSIVAVIGLARNNTAAVIGAMVIAPLLGPNVALSLASTLGDFDLAKNARKANLVGILLPLCLAAVFGMLMPTDIFDINGPEILSRTQIGYLDIILALAAGIAGTLSFTMALPGAIIGVMVAVALLPPLVTCGMLLGCGQWHLAANAGLLFGVNLICVNLAGVVTFLIQGVRPLWWWDKEKAHKATRRAIITWLICLAVLALLIFATKWQS